MCITNNGECSKEFEQTRGIHQGCALSGPVYLATAEILAKMLKENEKVKGVTIENVQEIVSQYADDTNVLSAYEQELLQEIINVFEQFRQKTGLEVNYKKSTLYKIGSARFCEKKFRLAKNFKWSQGPVDVLRIVIALDDLNDVNEQNLAKKKEKGRKNSTGMKSQKFVTDQQDYYC